MKIGTTHAPSGRWLAESASEQMVAPGDAHQGGCVVTGLDENIDLADSCSRRRNGLSVASASMAPTNSSRLSAR